MRFASALVLVCCVAGFSQAATVTNVVGGHTLAVHDAGVTGGNPSLGDSDQITATQFLGGGSFALSAGQGRGSLASQFTWLDSASGFILDLDFNGGVVAGPASVEAPSYGEIVFSTSGATPFLISGHVNGTADGAGVAFGQVVRLQPDPFLGSHVYEEIDAMSFALNYSEVLGNNPQVGTTSGILPAGDWRFTWEQRINNFSASGAQVNGAFRIEVGAVPEPSTWACFGIGLLLFVVWRRP